MRRERDQVRNVERIIDGDVSVQTLVLGAGCCGAAIILGPEQEQYLDGVFQVAVPSLLLFLLFLAFQALVYFL